MTTTSWGRKREELAEQNPDMLFADGLEEALLGTVSRFGMGPVALYDYGKCIEIFMRDGCSYEEAVEHFDFNVIGGWHGDNTPCFANLT